MVASVRPQSYTVATMANTTMIKMRCPNDVLERIDAEAERRGITRTALLLGGWLAPTIPAPAPRTVSPPASSANLETSVPTPKAFGCPVHPGARGSIGGQGRRFFCDDCRRLYGSSLAYECAVVA